jgi:hypothetical protein
MTKTLLGHKLPFLIIALSGLLLAAPAMAQDEAAEDVGAFDSLVAIEGAKADIAMIHPDADFSVYKRVFIADPWVAFIKNCKRTQNSQRRGSHRVSDSDMEKIKEAVSTMFKEVFTEKLTENGGYTLADEAGEDVLYIRPAVIDLDVTAPDTMTAGRSRTYTTSAGAATLYIELYDSVSGAIIGRAADRRTARQSAHQMNWSSSVTNRQEARRMFVIWADRLRAFLEEHYNIGKEAASQADSMTDAVSEPVTEPVAEAE